MYYEDKNINEPSKMFSSQHIIIISISVFHKINLIYGLGCQHMRREVSQQKKDQSSINAVEPKSEIILLSFCPVQSFYFIVKGACFNMQKG